MSSDHNEVKLEMKYVLGTYYMPGNLPDAGDIAVNKRDEVPLSRSLNS